MRPVKFKSFAVFCLFLIIFSLFFCCTPNEPAPVSVGPPVVGDELRSSTAVVHTPSAPETNVVGNDLATVDLSNISQGYIGVKYLGENEKVKLQITKENETKYTYNIKKGDYDFFPLSLGSGKYTINLYENIKDTSYALAFGTAVDVALANEYLPFLYSNQYVCFSADSAAVAKGEELARGASDELGVVENVYDFVINNISYDYDEAENVAFDYLPNVDEVLSTGKGICFDYAALMVAMLRSQNIPTRLVVGYAGEAYHAWISVYIEGVGWVNGIIRFDGKEWVRMDPTFAASSGNANKYIGDGVNYADMYFY